MIGAIVLAFVLGAPAQQAAAEQPWPPPGVTQVGPGITAPRLTREAKPKYTDAAREAKIQGVVTMEAVVKTDGTVGDVRVVGSLDTEYGLDDAAIEAVRTWRFVPGKKDGKPVPVLVEIEMTFTLRR